MEAMGGWPMVMEIRNKLALCDRVESDNRQRGLILE